MHRKRTTGTASGRLARCAAILLGFAVSGCEFLGPRAIKVPKKWGTAVHHAVDEQGKPFDWSQVHGDLIRIHSSDSEPATGTVYAKVQYTGLWFYIDATDIDSRETLTMISIVLRLKAGGVPAERPVLTLPVGG